MLSSPRRGGRGRGWPSTMENCRPCGWEWRIVASSCARRARLGWRRILGRHPRTASSDASSEGRGGKFLTWHAGAPGCSWSSSSPRTTQVELRPAPPTRERRPGRRAPPPNRRGLGARGFRPPRPGRARRPRPLPPLRHEPPPATPAMGLITHDESRGGPLRPLCHGRSGGGATARGGRRGGELFLLKAV